MTKVKYEVTNGRFATGDQVYEHGTIVELNESQVERFKANEIIGDTLTLVVEKKKVKAPVVPETDEQKKERLTSSNN